MCSLRLSGLGLARTLVQPSKQNMVGLFRKEGENQFPVIVKFGIYCLLKLINDLKSSLRRG